MPITEPLHPDPTAAVRWVNENTDNALFRDPDNAFTLVRVDQGGAVFILIEHEDGTWYWRRLRRLT